MSLTIQSHVHISTYVLKKDLSVIAQRLYSSKDSTMASQLFYVQCWISCRSEVVFC